MKQISTILFTALAGYVHLSAAINDAAYHGCYNSSGSLVTKGEDEFQSRGKCHETCVKDPGYSVDDSKCKQPCPGFETETCGTRLGDYISVYLSGLEDNPNQDPVSSSSSSAPTSTAGGTTTSHPSATSTSDKSASSSSAPSEPKKSVDKAGVAAGVVVGVLAVLGIGLGLFLFIRRRKRQQVEEEYKRSVAAREFAKKPQQDHRLDPVMIQRRDSVGSIADNQDYSRRILKVGNPST
ncbi:hypothetical protein L873DRAFT_1828321 [Choiromyces venosus 120613-1]|uniref:WSC domain-containing protein n=1 Tax=Choiromyces venosus 120613-1 TaxID=1336337 RepID=A0A3N4JNR1_9PEZI|nr:hypothetical protein L873DRAFT_1828321 [Choiromyces venosus 120613-1]